MADDELRLDVAREDDVTVITLGEGYRTIAIRMMDELRAELSAQGAQANPPCVVVDLPHTVSFDSTFMEVLVRMRAELVNQGGALALSSLSPDVRDVFRVTQLDTLIPCFGTRDEADRQLRIR